MEKISICCQTYNHEPYIRKCLDGFIMQKTTWLYEVLIHDDASKDKTADIIREYEKKYPDIIKPIYQTENQYSKGIEILSSFQYPRADGKYIALCEGDDYWTDPLKLQKQVNFLEANNEYSFCFHNAVVYYVDRDVSEDFNHKLKSKIYKTKDILMKDWFIPTASLFIRKIMIPNPFPNWYNNVYQGDYALELLLSIKGDFYYIDEKMSVYQKNCINSLSINGPKGKDFLKKQLLLLQNFKKSNVKKNVLAINYAIAKVRYKFFKVFIYDHFPFVVTLKNKILHRN